MMDRPALDHDRLDAVALQNAELRRPVAAPAAALDHHAPRIDLRSGGDMIEHAREHPFGIDVALERRLAAPRHVEREGRDAAPNEGLPALDIDFLAAVEPA